MQILTLNVEYCNIFYKWLISRALNALFLIKEALLKIAWMQWDILETGLASAQENMEKDRQLLEALGGRKNPILHLYGWEKPSLTFGHFIRPEKVLNVEEAKRAGLDWSRRPTGGGVVFHLWDLAFSVLVPASCPLFSENTLENYALVNGVVQEAVAGFLEVETTLTPIDAPAQDAQCSSFCMARPTKYDVVFEGKKIAGAAQRKTKDGFLHQGTISLVPPDWTLLSKLLNRPVLQAMIESTFPLFKDSQELDNGRSRLTENLKRFFTLL